MATYKTVIHGSNSDMPSGHRHAPTMSFQFNTPSFTRNASNPNGLTISFSWKFWIGSGSKYGYKIRAGVKINGSWYSVKTKETSPASGWSYSGTKTISLSSYTSTSITITVGAYAVDEKQCYVKSGVGWSNLYPIKSFTFKNVPSPYFKITYDANGGDPNTVPTPTNKQPGVPVNLTTDVPTFPTEIVFHNQQVTTEPEHRDFVSWNTEPDGTGTEYASGAEFTTDANCTLYAQWGDTHFVIDTEPDPNPYRVIFQTNNGTPLAELPYREIPRQSWYTENQAGTGDTYEYRGNYTMDTLSKDFYPQYGDAYVTQAIIDDINSTLSRRGYIFVCWCLDEQLTTPISIPQSVSQNNTILYAKWKSIPIYKKTDDEWNIIEPRVWKCVVENNQKVWKKIAPIYGYSQGTGWVKIDEGS